MAITRKDVDHVARLGRLALSDEEKDLFVTQLGKILSHAERVTSLQTDDVPPTSHPVPLVNVFRSDEPHAPLSSEEALANAPHAEEGQFRVPRILEDEG